MRSLHAVNVLLAWLAWFAWFFSTGKWCKYFLQVTICASSSPALLGGMGSMGGPGGLGGGGGAEVEDAGGFALGTRDGVWGVDGEGDGDAQLFFETVTQAADQVGRVGLVVRGMCGSDLDV